MKLVEQSSSIPGNTRHQEIGDLATGPGSKIVRMPQENRKETDRELRNAQKVCSTYKGQDTLSFCPNRAEIVDGGASSS